MFCIKNSSRFDNTMITTKTTVSEHEAAMEWSDVWRLWESLISLLRAIDKMYVHWSSSVATKYTYLQNLSDYFVYRVSNCAAGWSCMAAIDAYFCRHVSHFHSGFFSGTPWSQVLQFNPCRRAFALQAQLGNAMNNLFVSCSFVVSFIPHVQI